MRKFTDYQNNFIKENYPIFGVEYCCKHLNLNSKQIYDIAYKLNIKLKNGAFQVRIFSEKATKFIKDNYPTKGAEYCAKELKISRKRITNKASELGIHLNKLVPPKGNKICCKCKIEQNLNNFCKNKNNFDNKNNKCKKCSQEYYKNNKERHSNYNKKYNKKHKDKLREYKRIWTRNEIKKNSNFRLRKSMGCRIYQALKGIRKSKNTISLIGCSIEYLWNHLEKQFKVGMTKDNYGKIWHADHITPCSHFNLNNLEEQLICFNYTNLQPLWATTEIARKHGDYLTIGNCNKQDKILK